jgi:Rod binding domain-containing protein
MPQVGQLASANASHSLVQAKSDQILSQAKAHASAGDPQLEKTAKAFESILLAKWLEQAQHSFATVPGEDPDKDAADPGADQYRSLSLQSLAESISASGGVGIAKMIVRQLSRPTVGTAAVSLDSKVVNQQGTKEGLPPRNAIKVLPEKSR